MGWPHKVSESDDKVFESGQAITYEEELEFSGNDVREYLTRKIPLFDNDGNVKPQASPYPVMG